MNWLNKILPRLGKNLLKKKIPDGVWCRCSSCKHILYLPDLEKNMKVCTYCNYHMRINVRDRVKFFLDTEGREELFTNIFPKDFLRFRDIKNYKDRIQKTQKNTREKDALIIFKGFINNIKVTTAFFNFEFLGGSMGSVVGEKFVKAVYFSIRQRTPFICFTASGGARMQESLISLMQMAKTANAIADLNIARIPYIVVMTNPTTGGVSASLAMLGDINIAEPKATIGFAGRRVIQQTLNEDLPEDFQTSEFLLEQGMIDMIVSRHDLKNEIANLVSKLTFNNLNND